MAYFARFDDIGRPASLSPVSDDARVELPPEADDGTWSIDWLAARRCTDLARVADAAAWVMRDLPQVARFTFYTTRKGKTERI